MASRTIGSRARSGGLLALLALAACTASAGESRSATVVLFDVSNSTRDASVRARYGATFALVLAHLREDGGALGADIIDANPMVHGALPVNESFEPCTITDNALDCRQGLDEQEERVREEASTILANASRGTDVFGALALAEQFFAAYPDASDRTLVLLSDMVHSANGMHLGAIEDWSEAQISALVAQAPSVDLTGVRVYVVGAGATVLVDTTPIQIEGIRRFWTRWLEEMGARVEFYGANLARFPIEEASA
jgi:hypothetical protein